MAVKSAVVKSIGGKPHMVKNGKLFRNLKHPWIDVAFNGYKLDGWQEVKEPNEVQKKFLETHKDLGSGK